MSNTPALDLFCGTGGLSCGFSQAGFDIQAGVDVNEDYLNNYRENHDSASAINADLSEIEPTDFSTTYDINPDDIDVVIGGPPCKGFSLAGERDTTDERNFLVLSYIDYVEHFQPEFAVMENVVGIKSMELNGKPVLDIVKDRFEDAGYEVNIQTMKASDYGVPQKRERVVVVVHKPEYDWEYPTPTSTSPSVKNALQGVDGLDNHEDTIPNHQKQTIKDLSELDYGESRYDNYSESWKRIHPDKPAPTIKENHGAPFVHPFEDRVGSVRECARIQSFPDTYKFVGSKSTQLKVVGNAVPPKLATVVAEEIKERLS